MPHLEFAIYYQYNPGLVIEPNVGYIMGMIFRIKWMNASKVFIMCHRVRHSEHYCLPIL